MIEKSKKAIRVEHLEDALLNLITIGIKAEVRLKSFDYLQQHQKELPIEIQMQLRPIRYGNLSQQALRALIISLLLQMKNTYSIDYVCKLLINPRESLYIKNVILDSLLKNPKSEFIESLLYFIHQRSNFSELRAKAIWLIFYTDDIIGSKLVQDLFQQTHEDMLIQKTIIQISGILLKEQFIEPLFGYLRKNNILLNKFAIDSLSKYPSKIIFPKVLTIYRNSSSIYRENILKLILRLNLIQYVSEVDNEDVPTVCELITYQNQSHINTLDFINHNSKNPQLKQTLKQYIEDNILKIPNSEGFELIL